MTGKAFRSPSTGRIVRAVLFDTFGSVVDWRTGITSAVSRFAAAEGLTLDAARFADFWRSRYEPSMEPIRQGTRPFAPLDELHRENLDETMRAFGVIVSVEALDRLNHAWEDLPPWPDSVEGLRQLKSAYVVGPLSNANSALLVRMAKRAGLPWDVVIGADQTGQYKPRPEAYLRRAALLRLDPGEVMLAAAHNQDLAAARECGLATAFISRPTEFGTEQTTDLAADQEWDVDVRAITGLAEAMGCGPRGRNEVVA
jgi:2-haloacid dehalogenase